jgi:hypothetical protein
MYKQSPIIPVPKKQDLWSSIPPPALNLLQSSGYQQAADIFTVVYGINRFGIPGRQVFGAVVLQINDFIVLDLFRQDVSRILRYALPGVVAMTAGFPEAQVKAITA